VQMRGFFVSVVMLRCLRGCQINQHGTLRFQDGAVSDSISTDAQNAITADTSCLTCGYNLRGLTKHSVCPECGSPARPSVDPFFLRTADARFVRTISNAVNLIRWCFVLRIILEIILIATITMRFETYWVEFPIMRWGNGLGSLLLVVGGWLLTMPNPSGLGATRRRKLRGCIRWGVAAGGLVFAMGFLPRRQGAQHEQLIRYCYQLALETFACVGLVCIFAYLTYLARDIPDKSLARWAKFFAKTLAICLGIGLAVKLINLARIFFTLPLSRRTLDSMGSWITSVDGYALVILIVWIIIFLRRFYKTFRSETDAASLYR
jgi:hypothetical protein